MALSKDRQTTPTSCYNRDMRNLKIKSIKDIEKVLWMFYRYLPQPAASIQTHIVRLFPYVAVTVGAYFLSIAILPFIFDNFLLDPLKGTNLFFFNVILTRLLFAVMGGVIMVSFSRLVSKKLEGWYNMFYLTLFFAFFILVVFNIYLLVALLIFWYFLFAVKPDYS